MARSPLALAALATVAVPGLQAVGTRGTTPPGADYDAALVVDSRDRVWVVRAPANAGAGALMEAERTLLAALEPHAATLPFALPKAAGSVELPGDGRAVVYEQLTGSPLDPGSLESGAGLAAGLGRALARLHEIPQTTVADLALPTYSAEEYRARRLVELDQAASSGRVPSAMLTRWERALEDVGRWRFQPTFVHGDLVGDHVLVEDDRVVAIVDWGEAKIADPADDLAWLAVGADEAAFESVMSAYRAERSADPDPNLPVRARLAGELAIARWLMHGVHSGQQDVVDDAVAMLADLTADVGDEPL